MPLPVSLSLVIPVYRNEPNLEPLVVELAKLKQRLEGGIPRDSVAQPDRYCLRMTSYVLLFR